MSPLVLGLVAVMLRVSSSRPRAKYGAASDASLKRARAGGRRCARVATFVVQLLLGYSINSLSLFALVLAVGIVVDDAIVVVENVERHLEHGMTRRDAALKTMEEVGGALVSIALVLCAVFVPTAFLGGFSGQFFQQFAVTIAVATAISCFCSLTLSPALASQILTPHEEKRPPARWNIVALQSRLGSDMNSSSSRSASQYELPVIPCSSA